jgi:hypothetical protein
VVALYGELYAVERESKHMSPAERLALRRARSVALWDALRTEVARLEPLADPKSPLGKANTYFRRQQAALRAFLDHGELPISNAHVERLIRTVALFRKNSSCAWTRIRPPLYPSSSSSSVWRSAPSRRWSCMPST